MEGKMKGKNFDTGCLGDGVRNTITAENWRGKKQILQMEKRKSEKKLNIMNIKETEPRFMRFYYYYYYDYDYYFCPTSFPFYLITYCLRLQFLPYRKKPRSYYTVRYL
jgi:hypothetical protein